MTETVTAAPKAKPKLKAKPEISVTILPDSPSAADLPKDSHFPWRALAASIALAGGLYCVYKLAQTREDKETAHQEPIPTLKLATELGFSEGTAL